jgi:LysM repeat protein
MNRIDQHAAQPAVVRHLVRQGESLSELSVHYRLEPGTIAQANGIANPNRIREGAALTLPHAQTHLSGIPRDHGAETVIVRPGDTYASIGREIGRSPETLQSLNTHPAKALHAGDVLVSAYTGRPLAFRPEGAVPPREGVLGHSAPPSELGLPASVPGGVAQLAAMPLRMTPAHHPTPAHIDSRPKSHDTEKKTGAARSSVAAGLEHTAQQAVAWLEHAPKDSWGAKLSDQTQKARLWILDKTEKVAASPSRAAFELPLEARAASYACAKTFGQIAANGVSLVGETVASVDPRLLWKNTQEVKGAFVNLNNEWRNLEHRAAESTAGGKKSHNVQLYFRIGAQLPEKLLAVGIAVASLAGKKGVALALAPAHSAAQTASDYGVVVQPHFYLEAPASEKETPHLRLSAIGLRNGFPQALGLRVGYNDQYQLQTEACRNSSGSLQIGARLANSMSADYLSEPIAKAPRFLKQSDNIDSTQFQDVRFSLSQGKACYSQMTEMEKGRWNSLVPGIDSEKLVPVPALLKNANLYVWLPQKNGSGEAEISAEHQR